MVPLRLRSKTDLYQLLGAKSFEQVIEIQSQYARMAYEAYVAELSKLGEMYAGLTRNAYKPVEQALPRPGAERPASKINVGAQKWVPQRVRNSSGSVTSRGLNPVVLKKSRV